MSGNLRNTKPVAPLETEKNKKLQPVSRCDLPNQYFTGPRNGQGVYASAHILDSIITIERHDGNYHIAASFNVETTILQYDSNKSNNHEWFFHDICLQYLSEFREEELIMKPESDSTGAFAVTRNTTNSLNTSATLNASAAPTASVGLNMTRSNQLTVSYSMPSWNISAHRVASALGKENVPRTKGKWNSLKANLKSHQSQLADNIAKNPRAGINPICDSNKHPRYQWYWLGNHQVAQALTPDMKHSVKRTVVVKRIISEKQFPLSAIEANRTLIHRPPGLEAALVAERRRYLLRTFASQTSESSTTDRVSETTRIKRWKEMARKIIEQAPEEEFYRAWLEYLFDFSFSLQVRVKRRYGRTHRHILLSGDKVKGRILKPTYKETFHVKPDTSIFDLDKIPKDDTYNITALLAEILYDRKYDGRWEILHGADLTQLSPLKTEVLPTRQAMSGIEIPWETTRGRPSPESGQGGPQRPHLEAPPIQDSPAPDESQQNALTVVLAATHASELNGYSSQKPTQEAKPLKGPVTRKYPIMPPFYQLRGQK